MLKVKATSQTELKKAYSLVIQDLFTAFGKMKNNQAIRLNTIGTFVKKRAKTTSYLDKENPFTSVYWKISFRMSQTLKRALKK
jgi:hypothetical protein